MSLNHTMHYRDWSARNLIHCDITEYERRPGGHGEEQEVSTLWGKASARALPLVRSSSCTHLDRRLH